MKVDDKSSDICWAAYINDIGVVRKLIDKGISIESIDRDGRTPLLNSISGDNYDIDLTKMLIDAGADVNSQDSAGFTALHFCAQEKQPATAQLLINAGADVNLKDQWGNGPLGRSLGNTPENAQIIELLISSGADPYLKNESDISPMDLVLRLKSHPNHSYFKALHESRS